MIQFMILCLLSFYSVVVPSPIIDYEKTPEYKDDNLFQIVYLKHSSVSTLTPFLTGICMECHWVTDQSLQRIGVNVSSKDWPNIKKAIQSLDRKEPLVQLAIDVIEVTDIKSDKYQNMLYQLSEPIELATETALSLSIEYMISSGNAFILSSPRIMTKSGQSASISVGDRVPYTTVVQNNSSTIKTIDYIDSGIELKMTPHVHYNNQIDLIIELNYQTVSGYRIEAQSEMPIIASRSTQLSIQVPAGATVLFAGLLDETNHESIEKVPFLSDIPIIGGIFNRTKLNRRSTDLMYKITPTIIR